MKAKFEQDYIWKNTIPNKNKDNLYENKNEFLRVELEKFRDKAKILASEISMNLPDFTVHDITHIDALWEATELIVGKDFDITPIEKFVLGGAFFIHDLGMGLASFPNGVDELKKEEIWKDTVVSIIKKENPSKKVTEEDFINLDKEVEQIAIERVLRLLHAKQAENLAQISWKTRDGQEIFLIDDIELREAYGSIIGKIAYSHGWSVDRLLEDMPSGAIGAISKFPSDWTIDPIKLACILRIADAIQIDDGRAPIFLRTLRKPSSYSDKHWKFQQKLYKPILENNRLKYISKSEFSIDDIDSWWICYDTLQMIDNELKEVDLLLSTTGRQRLKAIGVMHVENPDRLSKFITVNGWKPVDTKIKITNIANLVSKLGGNKLYGDDLTVPLRELVQNASDAIKARRIYEGEKTSFGSIIIRFGKDTDGEYIEVEDNGIGMSQRVLTGPFLDFGESFWGTSLMHEEFPGLESIGYNSIGQYGIGFYSIFIWGEKASIYSRRFDKGRDSTLVLEFKNGVHSRPILRSANRKEMIKDGGTKVRVWLSGKYNLQDLLKTDNSFREKTTYAELIENLFPGIDCNIILEEDDMVQEIIKADDWITMDSLEFTKRIVGSSAYSTIDDLEKSLIKENMSLIYGDDGEIIGRAALYSRKERRIEIENNLSGIVTIGGFRTSELTGIIGILLGKSYRASRDIAIPIVSDKNIKTWATRQAEALSKLNLEDEHQLELSSIVRALRGNTSNLKIAKHKTGTLNYEMIKNIVSRTKKSEYIVDSPYSITNYERKNSCNIDINEDVFLVHQGIPGILQTRDVKSFVSWPNIGRRFHECSLFGMLKEALAESWGLSVEEVIEYSSLSDDEHSYNGLVGLSNGSDVILDHIDIIRNGETK